MKFITMIVAGDCKAEFQRYDTKKHTHTSHFYYSCRAGKRAKRIVLLGIASEKHDWFDHYTLLPRKATNELPVRP